MNLNQANRNPEGSIIVNGNSHLIKIPTDGLIVMDRRIFLQNNNLTTP